MIKKRSKFWTVAFSMLPGAGHMFNGFMKLGVSLMALFFAIAFLSATLGLGPIMLLAPVIWFYAFFDCLNKRFLDDDDFYAQKDYYLFDSTQNGQFGLEIIKKRKPIIGFALIGYGIYILWESMLRHVLNVLNISEPIRQAIYNLSDMVPQVAVSLLVIWAGIALIRGKKSELNNEMKSESEMKSENEMKCEDEMKSEKEAENNEQ